LITLHYWAGKNIFVTKKREQGFIYLQFHPHKM